MIGAPHWIGNRLYLGRTLIGSVEPIPDAEGRITVYCALPGGRQINRKCSDLAAAKALAIAAAERRISMMLGGTPDEITAALELNTELRRVARTIYRLNGLSTTSEVRLNEILEDLRRALNLPREAGPGSAPGELEDEAEMIER